MTTYTVKEGQTITDVIMQTTGYNSASNWNSILDANNFDSWCPELIKGQVLNIPDGLTINSIQVQELNIYPPINNMTSQIFIQIIALINIFESELNREFEDDPDYNFEDNPLYQFEN